MSPTPPPLGLPRPAAVVNADIRALWLDAGGRLTAAERRRYEALLEEWADAVRDDIVTAA
ncbi:hypothetical protein [Streptomyces sp. NPDC127072]|uniref:hypothetical protein n=1 Tax=Streptomyces sp. NPDC127072 TaxID=3347129 RepID=UPI003667A2F4